MGLSALDDIPYVKGVTLKFDGCGGDVTWSEIKACPSNYAEVIKILIACRIPSKSGLTGNPPT
jgi:hypothetical protein